MSTPGHCAHGLGWAHCFRPPVVGYGTILRWTEYLAMVVGRREQGGYDLLMLKSPSHYKPELPHIDSIGYMARVGESDGWQIVEERS